MRGPTCPDASPQLRSGALICQRIKARRFDLTRSPRTKQQPGQVVGWQGLAHLCKAKLLQNMRNGNHHQETQARQKDGVVGFLHVPIEQPLLPLFVVLAPFPLSIIHHGTAKSPLHPNRRSRKDGFSTEEERYRFHHSHGHDWLGKDNLYLAPHWLACRGWRRS